VPTPEEIEARVRRIRAAGSYDVAEGTTSEAASKTYLPVKCSLCRTVMYATPEEVGSELTCPDCETSTVVPPLETMPAEKPLSEEELAKRGDEYSLLDGVGQPSRDMEEAWQPYIGLKCSVCGTRLLATRSQIGEEIACPDCNKSTVVRAPRPEPPRSAPEIDRTQQYESAPPPKEPDYSPVLLDVVKRAEQRLKEEDKWNKETPSEPLRFRSPPGWLFTRGVLTFPFYPGVWTRWIVLSVCLVGFSLLFSLGQYLMSDKFSVTTYFLGLAIQALSLILAGVCIPMIFPILLAVVQETGEGNDRIQTWPELEWIDAILESLYILNSLAISGLPGVLLASYLQAPPLPAVLIAHGSALLLFPFALMSALDTGSPWTPFSLPVLKGIPTTCGAWIRFYFASTALLAILFVVAYFAPIYGGYLGIVLVAGLLVPTLMLYFRLLGRLAWFCSHTSVDEHTPRPESETEPDEPPYERFVREED
jgi:DNA-directed RNA polymerase subunit RPC12/RpoP